MMRFDEQPAAGAPGRGAHQRSPPGQAGFALLAALIVLVALTALAAGGFWLASAERKVSRSHAASVDASLLADAGLSDFLAGHRGAPPDTVSYGYAAGSARVTVERLVHVEGYDTLYRIVSTGTAVDATGDRAERAVETLAVLRPRLLETPAAVVALNGVDKTGTGGTISGFDGSGGGAGGCPGPAGEDGYGLAVPPGGYGQTGGGPAGTGGAGPLEGDPGGLLEDGGLAGQLGVDWGWLASGPGITGTGAWPVVRVQGDHSVGSGDSGRGALVVTGDLTASGGFSWDGLVLVGGYLDSSGDVTVRGAVVTGLNLTLPGGFVADSEVRGGPSIHLHTGCVAAASRAFAYLSELEGSWGEPR